MSLARLPGREFVDRTEADPVISWDVHVSGHLLINADAAAGERFLNALRTAGEDAVLDARVGDEEVRPEGVEGPWTSFGPLGSGPIDVIVRVRARTSQRAELRAMEIVGVIRAVGGYEAPTLDPCTAAASAPTGSPYAPTLT